MKRVLHFFCNEERADPSGTSIRSLLPINSVNFVQVAEPHATTRVRRLRRRREWQMVARVGHAGGRNGGPLCAFGDALLSELATCANLLRSDISMQEENLKNTRVRQFCCVADANAPNPAAIGVRQSFQERWFVVASRHPSASHGSQVHITDASGRSHDRQDTAFWAVVHPRRLQRHFGS